MHSYQKMYTTLFNAMTDAIECLKRQNFDAAIEILIRAQQNAEELYISADDQRSRN